jgi:type IV pilus assembly protein PilX
MSTRQQRTSHERRQRGTVLVISLIVLLVMTLIGITSMQTTVLEERMAGNLRDRNLSFQAAEAGLQLALTYIEDQQSPLPPTEAGEGVTALLWAGCGVGDAIGANDCVIRGDDTWLATSGNDYVDDMSAQDLEGGLFGQPKIAIEDRYVAPLDLERAAVGAGIHFYTVSALGYGASADTKTLLQTTIAKVYVW